MAIPIGRHLMSINDQMRFEPVSKRIRAGLGGRPVLDTTNAYLVWEPRRIVPMYAVPRGDLLATLTPCPTPPAPASLPPVLGPVNFGWHLSPGESFTVEIDGTSFEAAAFAPADPDLGGRLVIEWRHFDWVEEEQPVTGHPHDPFKRIDTLPSTRHVVVSHSGQVLADSIRATALYETHLPTRWYVPESDVRMDLLAPSSSTSVCAYKGQASYFSLSFAGPDGQDIAWTYVDPLPEAAAVRGLVCFYSERTDLALDGAPLARPRTPWSSPRDQERI